MLFSNAQRAKAFYVSLECENRAKCCLKVELVFDLENNMLANKLESFEVFRLCVNRDSEYKLQRRHYVPAFLPLNSVQGS